LLRFYDSSEQSDTGQWIPIRAQQLAEQTPTEHRFYKLVKRHGKPALRITQIGWAKVRLPGRAEALTLVVSRLAGIDKPMMLLTNLPVENVNAYGVPKGGCKTCLAFLHTKVGMRRGDSFSQESGKSRKDTNVSLVCYSSAGLVSCAGDDLFGLAC